VSRSEPDVWLIPKAAERLSGHESFTGSRLTVLDFWRWGFSDLRTNVVRGVLAEFLVASAVGDPNPLRSAWDNFDVTTPSGIRVEVKSSAYLQSWNQRRVSAIVFSGLTGRSWSEETAEYGATRELRADVYVFAIHTCREPEQYDPLDLAYWQFHVAAAHALRERGARSISKRLLDRVAPTPYPFHELAEAIEQVFEQGQTREADPSR
jgi:hypothetical protein